jgi:multiple sugar transport system substrate-binding protein
VKRSLLKFVILAVVVAIALISCQVPQSSTPSEPSTPVVLKLSGWGANPAEKSLLRQVLNDFEAEHPQIRVRFEEIADQYMDVIKTRLIGDAAPDVFYLDALEAPFLVSQGVLEPLDSYITTDFDISDFETTLLNPFKYQNHIYGLPKDYSTLALFYNKTAFADAGVTSPPITWDELRAVSKALTRDRNQDGRPDQYGFGVIPELARQVYAIRAFGGRLVDEKGYATYATDEGMAGLKLVIDQYQQDHTSAMKTDVGTNSGSEMFGQEKVAMVIDGNWAIAYLNDTFPDLKFDTAEVPTINGKPGTMVFTVAYVMNQQSQHKQEAWELISYLTGKVGMAKWTGTGFALPSRKSVAQALGYDHDPLRDALVAGVPYATPWQAGEYPAAVMNDFDNQFLSAMLGQQPLQQALLKAQQNTNNQIKASL